MFRALGEIEALEHHSPAPSLNLERTSVPELKVRVGVLLKPVQKHVFFFFPYGQNLTINDTAPVAKADSILKFH